MRPIQYELKGCKLINAESDEVLAIFDARAVREKNNNGDFAGSGIASGGHSYSIATTAKYNYEVYNHAVLIDGVRFIVIAKHPITHKPLGERFGKKIRQEWVLELE